MVSTNNNVLPVGGSQAADFSAAGLLRLIPSGCVFLLIILAAITDCDSGFEVPLRDAGEPVPGCEIGTQRSPQYNGPAGTLGVGICRAREEECRLVDGRGEWVVIHEEVQPQAEECNGLDDDCLGETPVEMWFRTYDELNPMGFVSIEQAEDGHFVLAANEFTEDGYIPRLIQFDENGEVIWDRSYEEGIYAFSVRQVRGGGFILSGSSLEDDQAWLTRVNDDGTEINWSRRYVTPVAFAYAVIQAEDDYFVLIGSGLLAGRGIAGMIKVDPWEGREIWSSRFIGDDYNNYTTMVHVEQTLDRGFILSGFTDDGRLETVYPCIIRTDNRGNEQWHRLLDSVDGAWPAVVGEAEDRGFLVAFGNQFVRLNSSGTEEWRGQSDEIELGRFVEQRASGNFYIVGMDHRTITSFLVNQDGAVIHSWQLQDMGRDFLVQSVRSTEEGYIIAGNYLSGSYDGVSSVQEPFLMRFCLE